MRDILCNTHSSFVSNESTRTTSIESTSRNFFIDWLRAATSSTTQLPFLPTFHNLTLHPITPLLPTTPPSLYRRHKPLFLFLFILFPIPPKPVNHSIPHPQHRTVKRPRQPLDELEAAFQQDVLAREVVLVCFGEDVVGGGRRRRWGLRFCWRV